MDHSEFNRIAWNNIATSKQQWFGPVDSETIDAARQGDWSIRLTGTQPIPPSWIGDVTEQDVLCLAGGGGHQGPVLAAAGAKVTVFDCSEAQLAIDTRVAKEHNLDLKVLVGDMCNLDSIADESFDLIVNPCSTNFCSEVLPVWREAFRVLRSDGVLVAGVINPVNYLFDAAALDEGKFVVRHSIPYSDLDLTDEEQSQTLGPERPIDFGHTLTDLIGGQLAAGFMLTDFMEDRWGGGDPLSQKIATFIATRATKSR